MITTTTALDALSAALAVARRNGREVRSIKDLLCDACGVAVALRGDYCHACADSLNDHYDATAAAHSMSTDDDGARYGCGDAEGENYLSGIRS